MTEEKNGNENDVQPITEETFIEALKKASRPVEDQEPVEDDGDEKEENDD